MITFNSHQVIFSLEKENWDDTTLVPYPVRTFNKNYRPDDHPGLKDGDIVSKTLKLPNARFPVKAATKEKPEKFDPQVNISTLAMIAEKGSQISDHFRTALETKDDELLFPGTAAGNPAYLLGLEGHHAFDSASHDQLRLVNLLRQLLVKVNKSEDELDDFYQNIPDHENHLLDFAVYRYPTVVNQKNNEFDSFKNPMSRYIRRPDGLEWESKPENHPFYYQPRSQEIRK